MIASPPRLDVRIGARLTMVKKAKPKEFHQAAQVRFLDLLRCHVHVPVAALEVGVLISTIHYHRKA